MIVFTKSFSKKNLSEPLSSQEFEYSILGSNNLEDLDKIQKALRDRRKELGKDFNGDYRALTKVLNKKRHGIKYNDRLINRAKERHQELSGIERERAIEDKHGFGKPTQRKVQDAKLNAKYKLQDLSDQYYGSTEGRSLAGDAALATAGLAGGYLAYKAIKKARYDKKMAKEQAESKFKK